MNNPKKKSPNSPIQGGRGHWTINYTGTQSFITTLSYQLDKKKLGTFI